MRPVAPWVRDRARRALLARARDVTAAAATRSVLVIAPHPDDETLGCAARILRARGCGARVTLVVITDGAASHGGRGDRQALVALRRRELQAAARRLGVPDADVVLLDRPDGGGRQWLTGVASDLTALIEQRRPDDVCVTPAAEVHVDHAAAGLAARRAVSRAAGTARLLEYPVWLWADWPLSRRHRLRALGDLLWLLASGRVEKVEVGELRESKSAALASYASQLGGTADDVALPADLVRRAVAGPELALLRRGPRLRPRPG